MGLPYTIPENGGSIYYRNGNDIINPNWSVANAQGGQTVNRMNSTTSLTYEFNDCLLYTSPSPRDRTRSRMPSSA